MLLNNNLRKQVDIPVWEWCRFSPAVSSAISSSCTADNSNFNPVSGRYIYYTIAAGSFWRYDTWSDTYEQLSSPINPAVASTSMRFSGAQGYFGRVISATSTTIQTGLAFGASAKGFKIRIVSGTGAGQERFITAVADPVVADFGAASAGAATSITDSTKYWGTGYVGSVWNVNNWVGYTVRLTLGTGLMQTRKILYNSTNVLTIGDVALQPQDPWCHTTWTPPAAGTQYQIESSVITVDTAWDTTPDSTSRYVIQSGGVYLLSTSAATPWYTLQYYDVIADTWYVKPALTNMISAAATDMSLERLTENSTIWTISIATAGTTTTLTDSTANWTANQWANYYVYIYSGTGHGQIAKIASNTSTVLTFATVTTAPDATSRYEIIGYDAGVSTASSYNTLSDSTKSWTANQYANFAVRIMYGTGAGQLRQIQSNTATALTLSSNWNILPDTTSVYTIQGDSDSMYFAWGGSSEIFHHRLGNIDTLTHGRILESGVACTLACFLSNSSHAVFEQGPIAISTIAYSTTTATVTTVNSHNFKVGQYVSIRGESSANATYYDGLFQIATVSSTTTFTYTMSGTPTANAVGVGAQTTTALYDATKDYRQTASGGTSGASTITFANPTPSDINGWYVTGTGISTVGSAYTQVVSGAGTTTLTLSNANSGTVSGLIVFNKWAPAATGTASSGTVGTVAVTMSAATPAYINGWYATGTGIGTGAYVVSGAGTTALVMSVNNSATISSAAVTFSQSWNPATVIIGNTAGVTITTGSAAGQAIQATSQTGNSVTFPTSTAFAAGVSRYVITKRDMIGATTAGSFNPSYNSSVASTTGTTTVLTDTTASITATASSGSAQGTTITLSQTMPANITGWYVTGTGIGTGAQVVSGAGTATLTLSVANSAAISSVTVTLTAWYANSLVGKRLKLLTSTGAGTTSEQTITANTTTTITVGTAFGSAPVATTAYSIIAPPVRGTGTVVQWASGMSDATKRGKYLFSARGGAAVGFDRLDITTDQWTLAYSVPAVETLSTGSMYAYDGGDRLYFTKEVTQRVYYLDLSTNIIHGAGLYPYAAGTAIIGNRMEIFTTIDGLKYLWLNRHSNLECFKQLIFY